jgi:DNA-binding Lrp family transcriptional regulator
MQSTIFDTPVLKLESLKTKFDTSVVSNSFVALIGDYIEARILQQLHYWCYSEYGVIIDKIRWIYKPIREWLSEAFIGFTSWQLRMAIASLLEKGLIKREKLYVKHHELKHNNPYWHPKNQTYYYSVNYDKLQKLIEQVENPETIENVSIVSSTTLSVVESKNTKCCEVSQNNTENTSIENISRDQSHPHLPCVSETEKEKNQRKQDSSPKGYRSAYNRSLLSLEKVDSVNPKVIQEDTNIGQVEENINQDTCTNEQVVQEVAQVERPRIKTAKGTRTVSKRMKAAPWKDEGQFKRFYRALIQAVPIVANARSPQGLAQTIIRQLRSGIPHSYWDDFVAGLPIGTSTKPEWEVEPGIPHPMFIEYLVEKLIKGNNSQTREQAMVTALNIASTPKQAIFFWKECKISLGNALDEAERHRKLGVKALPTPLWTKERPEPTIQEAAIAGTKIALINSSTQASLEAAKNPQIEGKSEPPTPDPWKDDRPDAQRSGANPLGQLSMREMLAKRGVKGFAKAMPKVSASEAEAEAKKESEALQRQQMNYKNHLNQMSVDEINDYLKDPILRAQLTPQLIDSNYELVMDYLGQIIGVKLSDLQIRETLKGMKKK